MMRIGKSTDIHVLIPGNALILGGIEVPANVKAKAHSDGDCLLHSIAEAMLGALALGDLGKFFPDDDPQYEGLDSKLLLTQVHDRIKRSGYRIVNIDTMIILEKPHLAPFILSMRTKIGSVLGIDKDQISIKATTAEKIGTIGKGEAIICEAIVLLEQVLIKL